MRDYPAYRQGLEGFGAVDDWRPAAHHYGDSYSVGDFRRGSPGSQRIGETSKRRCSARATPLSSHGLGWSARPISSRCGHKRQAWPPGSEPSPALVSFSESYL